MQSFQNCRETLDMFNLFPIESAKLETYIDMLWDANRDLNLFSRQMEQEDLIHLHLVDSLLGLNHFPSVSKVVDLGAGGGFPSIPLAIYRPDSQFVLVEKSPKKALFLDRLQWLVPNIRVVCGQVPVGITPDTDLVICRAFKPLPVILELTHKYLRAGGRYLLWKARREAIDEEIEQSKPFLSKKNILKVIPLVHPTRQVERHLIQIN